MAKLGKIETLVRWARERAVTIRRAPLPWIAALALAAAVVAEGLRRGGGAPDGPRYLVARHSVPEGQPIGAIDFTARPMPGEVSPEALTDQDLHRLEGFRTVRPLAAGEVLRRSAVARRRAEPLSRRLPFGARAYALERAVGIPLAVGDRVDVFGAPSGENARSERVAENLPIVAIGEDGVPVAAVPDPVVRLLEESRRRGGVTVVLRRPDEPGTGAASRRKKRFSVTVLEGDR